MRETLKVVEIDRRSINTRRESNRMRDERDRLDRQLSSAIEQRRRDWSQGFAAALDLLAQQSESLPTRGTRDLDPSEEPTAPYPIIDPSVIEAD